MTVAELLSRISSQELTEWMAFYQLEPFGSLQDEYRSGMIASVMANTVRDEKKRRDPYHPIEFMRDNFIDKKEHEAQNLLTKAMKLFGGRTKKNGDLT